MFFILVLLCIGILLITLSNNKKQSTKKSDDIILHYINSKGLTITKAINIPFKDGMSKFFIDDVNKKVNFITYKYNNDLEFKQFSYKDILKCEIIKDDKKVLVEDMFSIIDRLKQKEYIKKLGFRITFNDLSFPYLDILFINSLTGQTLTGLGHLVNSLNDWIAIMNIVIERGKEPCA
ncbi:hypothetical protein Z962_p0006 (plasmid) [Clostridium botulinum C/D str. BKT12695]|nr:hypothetical protein Z962_p0006 [Clostridium botulinum C/D str. BKT12695]